MFPSLRKNMAVLALLVIVLFTGVSTVYGVKATLVSPNSQSMGEFGGSVAVGDNVIVVGAYTETVGGNMSAGRVYVFNAKTDSLTLTLTSPNSQQAGIFGIAVAVNNGIIVVGAKQETVGSNAQAGRVYIYNATTGKLMTTLTSPNSQNQGYFGVSLTLSGGIVVVGALGETADGFTNAGRAYVFSAKTARLISTLTSPNPQQTGWFGSDVAINDGTVVVGAPGEAVEGNVGAGRVYVFNLKSSLLTSTLISPDLQSGGSEAFGASVALSRGFIVVGAYNEMVGGNEGTGRAYVFNATTNLLTNSLSSPNSQLGGIFGDSVAVSGSAILVGAPGETVNGNVNAGRVYVFNVKTAKLMSTLTSPNSQQGGSFGYSVALNGSTVVVGAKGETVNGNPSAGRAYIFPS